MTLEQTKKIIGYLGVEHQNLLIDQFDKRLELWHLALKNYEYDIVLVAVKEVLINCKFEPKVADIIEQIKTMHRALYPTAEDIWNKYESWLLGDYTIQETYSYNDGDCDWDYCKYYDVSAKLNCTLDDTKDCRRRYAWTERGFDLDRYKADFENLPPMIKDYFFGDMDKAKKLQKANETSVEITKNRFIKFYENAITKTELQNSVPKSVIDKIQGTQQKQLEQFASSLAKKNIDLPQDTSIDDDELEWWHK